MRILAVEDDEEVQKILKTNLEEETFSVDIAGDGEKGSYLARTNEYDLIILDFMLPKKDGKTICAEIRKAGKNTPIIMLTMRSTFESKVDLLNTGADDYLTKPFVFQELLARIRALMRRPKTLESNTFELDDLKLDLVKQRVTRCKKNIYLTRKEFALLEYLMRHRGLVLSRGTIMEHVWNADSDPFSNTVEAHILNLRRKIDIANKKKLLHTIPGRGYTLDIARPDPS